MATPDLGTSLELLPGYEGLSTRAQNGILNWGKQDGESKTLQNLIEIKRGELGRIKGIGPGALKNIWTWRNILMNGSNSPAKPKPVNVPKSSGYIYLLQVIEGDKEDKEVGDLVLRIDKDHVISWIETERVTFTMITYETPIETVKFRVDHTPQEVLNKILEASK
jgi:hypothetical protein